MPLEKLGIAQFVKIFPLENNPLYSTYSVIFCCAIQLPGLMEILNDCKSQKSYLIYMISHLAGFMIGFVILLLIAIYEEDINNLFE